MIVINLEIIVILENLVVQIYLAQMVDALLLLILNLSSMLNVTMVMIGMMQVRLMAGLFHTPLTTLVKVK